MCIPENAVARLIDTGEFVNLAGNYDYLSRGYYLSQDFEAAGRVIRPACRDMLDAYIPPLFLEKGKRAGVAVPEYYISNGFYEPPVIVDPINPFTLKGRVVLKPGHAKSIAKSLTRNFTYAICCQEIPADAHIGYFRAVLGWAVQRRFRALAATVWRVYNIPLAKVRFVHTASDEYLLSDISPLFPEDLSAREAAYIREHVTWES